jgi:hypothetical protein
MIWNNVITTPQRWMAYLLRRCGWVAFYLDKESRHCGVNLTQFAGWLSAEIPELHHVEAGVLIGAVQRWEQHHAGTCWLRLYEEGEKKR